jgi:hypothetical protein
MVIKAKDVVRDAPMVLAAAPNNSRQLRSPTLPSELVPRAACARADAFRRVQEFLSLLTIESHTAPSVELTGKTS